METLPDINVRRLKNGDFQADTFLGYIDGKPKRLRRNGKTKKEARAKLIAALQERNYVSRPGSQMTVGEALDNYEAKFERLFPNDNTRAKKYSAAKWMRHRLGDRLLVEMTPELVEDTLDESDLAPTTCIAYLIVLTHAVDLARRGPLGLNFPNFAKEVHVSNSTKRTREPRWLTGEEYDALMVAAKGFRLYPMWLCQSQLGLRPGEVAGLRWTDIDFEEGTIRISTPMKWGPEHQPEGWGDVKTGPVGKGVRTLRAPTAILEALNEWRVFREHLEKTTHPDWPDLVFCTSNGTPYELRNVRRDLAKAVKLSGIGGRLAPYDLRHSACMRWVDAGVPLEYIADLMGHETLRMAREVYSRRRTTPLDVPTV